MDYIGIKTKFKEIVKYTSVSFLISIMGVALIFYGTVYAFASGNTMIQLIGIVLFIGGIIVNSVVWRCPVCKKPLPRRQSLRHINYCSNCNAKLK